MQLSRRDPFRVTVALLASAIALAAATGVIEAKAFQYPSTLKYVLTIAAPLLVLLASTIERPLWIFTGALVIAIPFASASITLSNISIAATTPLLIAAAAMAVLSERARGQHATLALAGAASFPLLLVPLVQGRANRPFIMTLLLMLAVGWVVCRTAEEPGGLKVTIGASAVAMSIQAVIAIWEAGSGHQLNLYGTAGSSTYGAHYFFSYGTQTRPSGSLTDPISLGNLFAIALPPVAALAIQVRPVGLKVSLAGAALLGAAGLALTLSRESWIGAFVGLLIMTVLLPRRARRVAAPVLAAAVVVIAVVGVALAGSAITARFSSLADPTQTQGVSAQQRGTAFGDQNRLHYWKVAFDDAFLKHPVAGIGIDNMGPFMLHRVATEGAGIRAGTLTFIHAHSTYFQILGEAGLFGLALFALLFVGLWRDSRTAIRASPVLGAGLAGGVVALLICWVTDWVVHNASVGAWVAVLLGALAGAGRSARRDIAA